MKIIFIIESLKAGGKERRLLELIDGLQKNKIFECALIILNNNIHYEKAQQNRYEIFTLKRGNIFSISNQILNICKAFKPEIIHSWAANATIYSLYTVTKLKLKLIDSSISTAPNKVKIFSKINLINQIIFRNTDLIIANSQAGLKSYNVPKNKSIFIHNGFDFNRINNLTSKNEIRRKFSISTKKVVTMVASFSEKKDYNSYISAALIILDVREDITFLCIGTGDSTQYEKMVPIAKKDYVKFLGRQSDVESIINICDISILATYTEGISNSLMESMALGKPVIATDGGGTSELVINNETGYLVSPQSHDEIADKILKLLDNNSLRNLMGEKSKVRIEEKFNITKMTKLFLDAYNQVLRR